ncbi:putative transcription factor MYB-HB-like family [Rosa chinensis]|uniref:Putative transcription factor MYB-HB-like family n=1 Tax=Rosa chinensis TaxID=74649 RepID=A0A2P6SKM8_ROSCH|nr:telomere repeat-binding protein 4 [Rosa chinensis]XP_040365262.1 telomere repeat-binding protein 4 [Rosa chinensis]PRQ59220.1 putative transcription factor MYB-HB-like family [Rosa chinensis]
MVLKKRLDFGFNGFQVPTIPRAPRSARRRGPQKKLVEDGQICAFELLASIAGKLLQESESSSASSHASPGNSQPAFGKDVKQEIQDEHKPPKDECLDHGCSEESVSLELTSKSIDQKCTPKEFLHAESDTALEHASIITNSGSSDKVACQTKSVIRSSKPTLHNYSGKLGRGSPGIGESSYGNLGIPKDSEGLETGGCNRANTCSSKDPMELHAEYPATVNGDNNDKLSLYRDLIPNASFSRHRNDTELGIRDDDENFSRCNKLSTKVKVFRPPSRIGDRRLRKLLTSKYWKVAPKLSECDNLRYDGGVKPTYHKRKIFYNRERSQRDTLCKRRKMVERSSVVTSDGGFSGESVSYSPEKGMNGDKSVPAANGVSSSVIGPQASLHSKESHVKFRIKSFRVPELFIEVPETETVGSLKRTVMEAVNAILNGGLSVGVLVQGKKVRDDNRTLLQTGISCKDNLDSLGFTLEPSPVQAPPSLCPVDLPPLSCEASVPLPRSPSTPLLDSGISDAISDPPPLTNSGSLAESNHESVSSLIDPLTNKAMPECQAIVALPDVNMEPLAAVPVNQKSKRSELVQRRTRRPFSVSEVEALVQAVEELGTGRWRDVKLCAFENADHRTYVDLKDKWKTLVHTAQISPQQRRGEPVPQELLDRVLAAHSYWCQHQAKQHGKHQVCVPRITDTSSTDRHGAERYSAIV